MTLFDPGDAVAVSHPSRIIGEVGKEILRYLATNDSITPTEAGMLCHDRRRRLGKPGCGVGAKSLGDRSAACCAYASADGLSALNRLVASGYVVKTTRGRYEATS